jgi:thioredoxin-like negative regulator of GroEL
MNTVEFKNAIWDFTGNENDFVYKGKKPAIVHFYSPRSATYKVSISILDELGRESKGKFDVYKVNGEQEEELIRLLQIKDYPAFLFITKKGEPEVYVGFKTKDQLAKLIDFTILK